MGTVPVNYRDATRQQAKACIVIEGLSGLGKSGLALTIANVLADGKWADVFACDTENKSLDLFQGITTHLGSVVTPFKKLDLLPMHGYAPSNYVACKNGAISAGGKVFVADSISHMWTGKGGVLSLVADAKANDKYMDNYRVWGLDNIAKEKNLIFEAIRDSNIHMISTVRVKEKHEMVMGTNGHNELKSLGEQEIQMPDLKYEPDLVLSMVSPGNMTGKPPVAKVLKSRYVILQVDETYDFTLPLIKQLKAYLEEGADPEVLREQQRIEYIETITKLLDASPSAQTILPTMKEQLGFKDVPLKELKLNNLRTLYSMLVS